MNWVNFFWDINSEGVTSIPVLVTAYNSTTASSVYMDADDVMRVW